MTTHNTREIRLNKILDSNEYIVRRKYKLSADGKIKEASKNGIIICGSKSEVALAAREIRPEGGRVRITNFGSVYLYQPHQDTYIYCGKVDISLLHKISSVKADFRVIII